MVRPKSQQIKLRINLSIEKTALDKGKVEAESEGKSLSQFTEDYYKSVGEIGEDFSNNPIKTLLEQETILKELRKQFEKQEASVKE